MRGRVCSPLVSASTSTRFNPRPPSGDASPGRRDLRGGAHCHGACPNAFPHAASASLRVAWNSKPLPGAAGQTQTGNRLGGIDTESVAPVMGSLGTPSDHKVATSPPSTPPKPAGAQSHLASLGMLQLVGITYFSACGGPFGFEEAYVLPLAA